MPDKYMLVNAYDEIVKMRAKQFIAKEEGMCQCEKCFLDVCAIVFNRGYTNFVTTRKGRLIAQLDESAVANQVELTVTIMDAIKIVKASPVHLK